MFSWSISSFSLFFFFFEGFYSGILRAFGIKQACGIHLDTLNNCGFFLEFILIDRIKEKTFYFHRI